MKASLKKTLASIKQSGMSHIKFELEAQLGRQRHSIVWKCDDCEGRRVNPCNNCNGTGIYEGRGLQQSRECPPCVGSGGAPCSTCRGIGHRGNFADLDTCRAYILNEIAIQVYGKSLKQLADERKTLGANVNSGIKGGTALPFIEYVKFYYDGSVDSEMTITIPIEEGEKALAILQAFKKFADLSSNGSVDTRGAGMHIAVLPEGCNGRYPSETRLNREGLQNFTTEVTKLLPALYFVGTAGHRSRSMQFRSPQISDHHKYSAVYTLGGRVFEFRVFETCYDRPEAVYEYMQVIANALKFYADPTRKVKALGKKFGFPSSTEIAHYYSTTEQLRILNATVKYLKPEDKTFKAMKQERGLRYTVKTLETREKSRLAQLKNDYAVYKRHWEQIQNRPFNDYEKSEIDWMMVEKNYTQEKAEAIVRGSRGGSLVPLAEFLRKNLTKQRFNQTVTV